MTLPTDTPILFKYLNFLPYGARGGVTRFFMLSQGIPFTEELITPGDDWATEKQRVMESGENPAGSAPMLYAGTANSNNKAHPQHIAVSRYLARIHKLTSGDDYKDYVQDLVADEYQGFRDQWVQVTFMGDDDDKAAYKKGDLIKQLTKFDALYNTFKTEPVYLSVSAKTSEPLWGDAAVFGLLRDHILTGYITKDDLKEYTNLIALYDAYAAIPAVKEWLDKVESK